MVIMSTEVSATAPEPSSVSSSSRDDDRSGAILMRTCNDEPAAEGAAVAASAGSPLIGLPLQLDVMVPIPSFRIENLLALEKGIVIESHWHHADDIPVWCGGAQLAWAEFEVVEKKLAVRVTRIS